MAEDANEDQRENAPSPGFTQSFVSFYRPSDSDFLNDQELNTGAVVVSLENGVVMGNEESYEELNADDDVPPEITFDRNLPASHAYLGNDLEDVGGGQALYEPDSVLSNVPLYPLTGFILMPHQNLPLQSIHIRMVSVLRSIIARSQTFGVVDKAHVHWIGELPRFLSSLVQGIFSSSVAPPFCHVCVDFTWEALYDESGISQHLADIGTLAQVLAYRDDNDERVPGVKLRAVGRQRFRIISTRRQLDGLLCADVRILPEETLTDLVSAARLPSMARFRVKNEIAESKRSPPSSSVVSLMRHHKYFACFLTSWPMFICKHYDVDDIVKEIAQELKQWYRSSMAVNFPTNPMVFSYWVASNLPLSDVLKLQLLKMNCTLQRLRCELAVLKKYTVLCCRECGQQIGKKSSIFSMSVEGAMGAYVNMHGYVHETLTLRHVTGTSLSSGQSTEMSWFPGYAWKIMQCSHCSSHIGWKFTAVDSYLKPTEFYGVTRMSVLPMVDSEGVNREVEAEF
ncbi:unnamed protein product [Soboliphyme baturini]|uniref:Protein cereblon n=1 Tax=Soboliphyme baturini TaxID=241478 RepID=A0A183IBU2_9BILA|nr:unnamed protein product [Soboliphyme baturini]